MKDISNDYLLILKIPNTAIFIYLDSENPSEVENNSYGFNIDAMAAIP
jgi:hypothetical protein